jgi:hypothetical protein
MSGRSSTSSRPNTWETGSIPGCLRGRLQGCTREESLAPENKQAYSGLIASIDGYYPAQPQVSRSEASLLEQLPLRRGQDHSPRSTCPPMPLPTSPQPFMRSSFDQENIFPAGKKDKRARNNGIPLVRSTLAAGRHFYHLWISFTYFNMAMVFRRVVFLVCLQLSNPARSYLVMICKYGWQDV